MQFWRCCKTRRSFDGIC